MSSVFTWKDIVAIKNINGHPEKLVYLGAEQPPDERHHDPTAGSLLAPSPGVWSRVDDLDLRTPATYLDGRVGDFLAVSSTANCSFIAELFGQLVALKQHGLVTHLGVIRTDAMLLADITNAKLDENGQRVPFDKYVWMEVLAMKSDGVRLSAPYDAPSLPYNKGGPAYYRLDQLPVAKLGKDGHAGLRKEIWNGFQVIRQPAGILNARRPAIRP